MPASSSNYKKKGGRMSAAESNIERTRKLMKKMQRLGVVDDRVVRLGSPVAATNEMLKQYPEEVLNARLAVLDEAYNHFFMKGPGHNLKSASANSLSCTTI